jgi:hypothetical protein
MNPLAQVAFLIAAIAAAPGPADPGRATATRIAEALSKGDVPTVAQSLHYPPSYTAKEKAEDIAGVSTSLAFLLGRFGLPKNPTVTNQSRVFFHLGTTGGTVPYWESVSPYKNRLFIYDVDFANFGRGVLVVELIALNGGVPKTVRGVEFGLLADQTDAKKRIVNAFEGLLTHMGEELPPNFRELATQQIQPFAAPASSPGT